jgi:hypothetical protein
MLLVADLIEYAEPVARTIRLLWLGPVGQAYTIDVHDAVAIPQLTTLAALLSDIANGHARLKREDALPNLLVDTVISDASRASRDRAWDAIEPLLSQLPDLFDRRRRAKLINEREAAGFQTRVSLYGHLRRYWQRGMTKNALLGDYPKCGGKGKVRKSNPDKKRGRPRKFGDLRGVNITEETRRIFQIGVDRYCAGPKRFTKKDAYDDLTREFFSTKEIDPETGTVTHTADAISAELGFPSYDQFLYWVGHDNLAPVLRRRKLGTKIYDKDHRGLIGTSTAETWGPGARFQIDATIADVYLVSRLNRKRIIGRPVLYVVIDVFSRMIVGIYVGLEGPSWMGAMMALANTAEDKVAFCRRYGRVIEPDLWPCHHLPAAIMGDGGEIAGTKIETLARNFNIRVETAASYRADWKGVVERRFGLLQATFGPYVPGYIDVDYRERGGTDYRCDAVLDIDEFTRIIIECVLYYNNQHELKTYDADRGVVADQVPPIPVELWDWGIEHKSGSLRHFPYRQVQFLLMPTGIGSVTEHGILFQGRHYTSQKAMEERWFDRARQDGRWPTELSFDSRLMDQIYLHDPTAKMGFESATLTERDRAYVGLTLSEIGQHSLCDKHASANRRQDQQLAKADLTGNIETVVNAAREKLAASSDSSGPDVHDIRHNREDEKIQNRGTEVFRPGVDPDAVARSADVLPFPRETTHTQENYCAPGIAELIGDEE